jgi:hypothetical protein
MIYLSKMGIFQLATLVYQRVSLTTWLMIPLSIYESFILNDAIPYLSLPHQQNPPFFPSFLPLKNFCFSSGSRYETCPFRVVEGTEITPEGVGQPK